MFCCQRRPDPIQFGFIRKLIWDERCKLKNLLGKSVGASARHISARMPCQSHTHYTGNPLGNTNSEYCRRGNIHEHQVDFTFETNRAHSHTCVRDSIRQRRHVVGSTYRSRLVCAERRQHTTANRPFMTFPHQFYSFFAPHPTPGASHPGRPSPTPSFVSVRIIYRFVYAVSRKSECGPTNRGCA